MDTLTRKDIHCIKLNHLWKNLMDSKNFENKKVTQCHTHNGKVMMGFTQIYKKEICDSFFLRKEKIEKEQQRISKVSNPSPHLHHTTWCLQNIVWPFFVRIFLEFFWLECDWLRNLIFHLQKAWTNRQMVRNRQNFVCHPLRMCCCKDEFFSFLMHQYLQWAYQRGYLAIPVHDDPTLWISKKKKKLGNFQPLRQSNKSPKCQKKDLHLSPIVGRCVNSNLLLVAYQSVSKSCDEITIWI